MDQNTRTVLSLCRDIEDLCADIYLFYAEAFADQPDLRILLEKTAYEEKNHAGILKIALNCKDLELAERRYDLAKFRNYEKIVRSIYENLCKTKPSVEDALRSSINLEKKLSEFHLECIADFKNKSEEHLFHMLVQADKNHLLDLENAYKTLLEDKRSQFKPLPAVG